MKLLEIIRIKEKSMCQVCKESKNVFSATKVMKCDDAFLLREKERNFVPILRLFKNYLKLDKRG